MTRFSIDLPFLMSLDEDNYLLNLGGRDFRIQHRFIERERFDPRIGSIEAGSFGIGGDPLGAVRYSRLLLDAVDEDLDQASTTLVGRTSIFRESPDFIRSTQERAEIALGIINRFLDKYRIATRRVDVKPIVPPWDLALVTFDDGQNSGEFRLYGLGLTLPITGLSPEDQQRVRHQLAASGPNATFELAAVDALRALEDGESLEAIITAVGALEAALDLYFSRVWRLAQPRVYPVTAVTVLSVNLRRGQKVYTIEDVLEASGIRAKVKAYAAATDRADEFQDLYDAIELRNLAVHSGVRVPVDKARSHVERMARFVLDDIVPKIETEYPGLPRAELLYACEESLRNDCAPGLEEIATTYLTGRGLTAKLYNQRYKRKEMFSERFGETLVIRVTFEDFGPDAINLFIARSLLFHYLERRGDIARARADYDPSPFAVSRRPFFEVVATGMTHVVWSAAINQRLRALGFDRLVQEDAERRSKELQTKYGMLQSEPGFEQLGHWVDYLDLASVAAELPAEHRKNLLRAVAATAPQTAARAYKATQALERASFEDRESILEALIRVHDAHGSILASAPVFDPVTQQWYGFGLRLEDFGVMSIRRVSAANEG